MNKYISTSCEDTRDVGWKSVVPIIMFRLSYFYQTASVILHNRYVELSTMPNIAVRVTVQSVCALCDCYFQKKGQLIFHEQYYM